MTRAREGKGVALLFAGGETRRIWGMATDERLRRMFARHGVGGEPRDARSVIVARRDAVIDPALVAAMLERPGVAIVDDEEGKPLLAHVASGKLDEAVALLEGRGNGDGIVLSRPAEMGAHFHRKLRKREAPHALLLKPENRARVEWRSFMGTYKGATDVITKRVWPWPAFVITRWLAEHTSITPNMITFLSAIMVVVAFALFAAGEYGWGLAAAWLMTFLDTVDGKLARTTLTSSRFGDIFDHGIDLVHPPFWYAAWALGLEAAGHPLPPEWWWGSLVVIIAGYVIQRLFEGLAIALLGMEIHIWRPIDTFFREITARRNPNLVILTVSALIGRPDWGLVAVAAWTGICMLLHAAQLLQALREKKRRGGRLRSWMEQPPATGGKAA